MRTSLLHQRLAGSPCRVHGSNLKVRSPAGAIMYPDAFVRCGPSVGDRTVVDDPVLVIEVLSPRHPAGRSHPQALGATRLSTTLQAILFVAADEPRVELAVRGADGTWLSRLSLLARPAGAARVAGLALPLADLFAGAASAAPTHEFGVDGTGRAHARSARGAAHRLGLSRLPRPAGGGDPARPRRRRRAGPDADRRRQVAVLPGAGPVPGRAHASSSRR